MTTTDELIERLVQDLRPVPRAAIAKRVGVGIAVGTLLSTIILILSLGIRPDLTRAVELPSFWMKVGYTGLIAVASLFAVTRLARPDTRAGGLWFVTGPLLLFAPAGAWELAQTAPIDWFPILLGQGWRACTWLVLGLSAPVYLGLLWAFRQFAPTNLEAAGTAAGVASGAVSGGVYCLHCPTDTLLFALAWYTPGILLAGFIGAALARRLMRW